ncbi:hypothetical protein BC834DRAFT_971952 [Gloeopeniophorella convolvens]|nr:hypothetical protein BC834DRAFT_971952 [Gloeopeniophorella convolvens]
MSPHDLWKGIAPTVTAIQATNASTDYAPGNAAGYPGVPSYSCPAPAPSAGYSANGYAFNDPVPRPDNAASYVPTQNSAAHGSAHQGAADWTAQPPPTAPQAPPANLVTFGDLAGRWMRIIQVEPNGYTGAARFVLEIA